VKELTVFLVFMISFVNLVAQTCCSSGVPIASNLGFQPKERNVLQVSLAYEYNRLETLYNESEVLDNNNRLRITNSGLARLAYSFHDRISIEALLPYVGQQRVITQNNGETNEDGGHGVGDVTALAQFVIVENQFSSFSVGGGIKLPTGANDLRGSQSYKFGNEIQANVGCSDQLFFLNTLIYPSASFRFSRYSLLETRCSLIVFDNNSWDFFEPYISAEIRTRNNFI